MPANEKCSEEDFIKIFVANGAAETARIIGCDVRNVQKRRVNIERLHGIELKGPNHSRSRCTNYPSRLEETLKDGILFIGSDAHVWPGEMTASQRAMILLAKELKPKILCLNGDILDGATISRHPPIGWENPPKLTEELEAVDLFLDALRKSAKGAELIWTIGNHDARFESKLAAQVPQFAKVHGTKLSDHFPHWIFTWSLWINNDLVVKHRFKGGVHAAHNNTINAGKSMATGHLHSLKVTPFDDYNGTRYGIDTGTLGDTYGEHAAYMEENPRNHRSGFIVCTFVNGKLLLPEIVAKIDDTHVQFRGKIIQV